MWKWTLDIQYTIDRTHLVQSVPNDLNVEFVQVLFRDAINEVRCQRRIYEHSVVELGRGGGDMDGLHGLEASKLMAFWNQFGNWTLMQRTCDQQYDVIDHVAVSERTERVSINLTATWYFTSYVNISRNWKSIYILTLCNPRMLTEVLLPDSAYAGIR